MSVADFFDEYVLHLQFDHGLHASVELFLRQVVRHQLQVLPHQWPDHKHEGETEAEHRCRSYRVPVQGRDGQTEHDYKLKDNPANGHGERDTAGHAAKKDELDELEPDEDSIHPEIVVFVVNGTVILRKLFLVGLVDEGDCGDDACQEIKEDGEDEKTDKCAQVALADAVVEQGAVVIEA